MNSIRDYDKIAIKLYFTIIFSFIGYVLNNILLAIFFHFRFLLKCIFRSNSYFNGLTAKITIGAYLILISGQLSITQQYNDLKTLKNKHEL